MKTLKVIRSHFKLNQIIACSIVFGIFLFGLASEILN